MSPLNEILMYYDIQLLSSILTFELKNFVIQRPMREMCLWSNYLLLLVLISKIVDPLFMIHFAFVV